MITRAPRPESNFYILDKAISGDKRLSWAARGLLVFLLGKPDHWQVSPAALTNETKDIKRSTGRDGVYAILKELQCVGYLQVSGKRNESGNFAGSDYVVTESPDVVLYPHTAQPDTAQPYPANPPQVSIEKKQVLIKKTIARQCVLPESFKPDATAESLAETLGVNVPGELAAFTDHHQANGSLFTDWQAAFRTWTRNAAKFAQRNKRNGPAAMTASKHNSAESFSERDARAKREAWEVMSGRKWPEQDLPASARRDVIEAQTTPIRRIA